MRKIYFFLTFLLPALILPITVLFAADTITERSGLSFPDTLVDKTKVTVIVAPTALGAAVFDITGTPNAAIDVSVLENRIYLEKTTCAGSCSQSEKVAVSKFTPGGSVDNKGRGTIDPTGNLTNIRIGGKLKYRAGNLPDHILVAQPYELSISEFFTQEIVLEVRPIILVYSKR